MDISLLNVLVTFQKAETVVDEIGNHTLEWKDYYICHTTVSGEGGTETVAAGTTVDNVDISFTVRHCKVVDTITSTEYRVLFREEMYNILSIDHMNFKRKSVKFRCKKIRR